MTSKPWTRNTTICTCGHRVEEHAADDGFFRLGPPCLLPCHCVAFHADPQLCAINRCANKASPMDFRDGPYWLCNDCYEGLMSGDHDPGDVRAEIEGRDAAMMAQTLTLPTLSREGTSFVVACFEREG
ncbi:hypothetical protein CMI37_21770 [Candidatus Pacearchaeota archaeon]|nr:hypothetical protein [Candidatus Pacearchaeota archaeon]|tara:strand:+ start:1500 stop:1883 length:384 start_codon:yes stop_codon:yes gene_type:complete